jgi:hypothetical protein
MSKYFELAAATFAFLAAAFWFWSAYGDVPPMLTYWDRTPDHDPFRLAIELSAKLNRWAAGLSGASALCVFLAYVSKR